MSTRSSQGNTHERDEPAHADHPWAARFHTPVRYTVIPTAGPDDDGIIVTIGRDGPSLELWTNGLREGVSPVRPLDGDLLACLPTANGQSIIRLRDAGGSELGHAWLASLTTHEDRDLTPDLPPYSLRGLDVAADGSCCLLTVAHEEGFELWLVDLVGAAPARRLYASQFEAWNGRLSADASMATVDSTDHSPHQRRFAVTAIDVGTGRAVGELYDPPAGTARAVRFAPSPGDHRVLVVSERSGFARPAIWDPINGARREYALVELQGDVHPLDWAPNGDRILVAHVDAGVHVLYQLDVGTGSVERVPHPHGAVFQPSIVTGRLYVFASHYAPDGTVRIVREAFDQPMAVLSEHDGDNELLLEPHATPSGVRFASHLVYAEDGTASQLWLGTPEGEGPWPTVLEVHGGPTFVTTDHFNPAAQAWIDEGFAYASLNYRGSVTFGREFREAFLGKLGTGEIEDIRGAAEFLTQSGVAVAGEMFITGESYGGYLTLLSLGKLPEHFAGGWAYVPMADWALAYPEMNPALKRAVTWFLGGTPAEKPDAYRRASARTYIPGVRAPLWVKSGTNDTRTPPSQIRTYVHELKDAGGDVTLEWFDGGHGTITVDGLVADQQTMVALARRALRGEPWSREGVNL